MGRAIRSILLRIQTVSPLTLVKTPRAGAEADFTARCSRCGDCLSACPTGILRKGEGGFPVVDFSRGECTFCGDCVNACMPGALHRLDGQAPWSLSARIGEAVQGARH